MENQESEWYAPESAPNVLRFSCRRGALRKVSKYQRSRAPKHQTTQGAVNERFTGCRESLVVLAEPTVLVKPGKRSLQPLSSVSTIHLVLRPAAST